MFALSGPGHSIVDVNTPVYFPEELTTTHQNRLDKWPDVIPFTSLSIDEWTKIDIMRIGRCWILNLIAHLWWKIFFLWLEPSHLWLCRITSGELMIFIGYVSCLSRWPRIDSKRPGCSSSRYQREVAYQRFALIGDLNKPSNDQVWAGPAGMYVVTGFHISE
jgi:hypothetical protein